MEKKPAKQGKGNAGALFAEAARGDLGRKARLALFTSEATFTSATLAANGKMAGERTLALAEALRGAVDVASFAAAVEDAKSAVGAIESDSAFEGRVDAGRTRVGKFLDARHDARSKRNVTLVAKNATGSDFSIVARSPFAADDTIVARWPDGAVAAFVEGTLVGFDGGVPTPRAGVTNVPVARWALSVVEAEGGRAAHEIPTLVGAVAAQVPTVPISETTLAYRVEEKKSNRPDGPRGYDVLSREGELFAPFLDCRGEPLLFADWIEMYGFRFFDPFFTHEIVPGADPAQMNARLQAKAADLLFVVLDDGESKIAMKKVEAPTYRVYDNGLVRLTLGEDDRDELARTATETYAADEKGLLIAVGKAKGRPYDWIARAEELPDVVSFDPESGAPVAPRPIFAEIAPGVPVPKRVADDPEVKEAVERWIAGGAAPGAWATTLSGVERAWAEIGVSAEAAAVAAFDPARLLTLPNGAGFLLAAPGGADRA